MPPVSNMQTMRLFWCVLAGMLLAGCAKGGGSAPESELPVPSIHGGPENTEPKDVSLIELIADPGGLDGRTVWVEGFAVLEFEGTALYLHREDADQLLLKNGVWLATGWPVPERWKGLDQRYIRVEATVDARDHGHLGGWSAALTHIHTMAAIGSRADYARVPPPPAPSKPNR